MLPLHTCVSAVHCTFSYLLYPRQSYTLNTRQWLVQYTYLHTDVCNGCPLHFLLSIYPRPLRRPYPFKNKIKQVMLCFSVQLKQINKYCFEIFVWGPFLRKGFWGSNFWKFNFSTFLFFRRGGGVPYPIFLGTNLFVRFKLGYTPNFTFLGLLQVA